MKAVNPISNFEYVCKCDQGLEDHEKTIFRCRVLTVQEQAAVDDMALSSVDGKMHFSNNTRLNVILNIGLIEVKNLIDDEGKEVRLKRKAREDGESYCGLDIDPISEEFISRIPKAQRNEIANEIYSRSTLSVDDLKN